MVSKEELYSLSDFNVPVALKDLLVYSLACLQTCNDAWKPNKSRQEWRIGNQSQLHGETLSGKVSTGCCEFQEEGFRAHAKPTHLL